MTSTSDTEILQLCKSERRTVITSDRDFGALTAGQSPHPGVILLRLGGIRSAAIVERLTEALASLEEPPGGYSDKIIVIEPGRVRIRVEGGAAERE
jgi:predicted nuclease of predicted toxin-antitoxin system